MNIQVIKRNGSKELFDPEKIDRVVVAAGLSPDKATTLVKNISDWVTNQKSGEISSLLLRDKVIEELEKSDEYAANMFAWYQKTKEKAS
jgi:transcriptional regulator NrdR family protein